MNHQAKLTKPVADMSEDELTEWLCSMPPPGPAPTDEEFATDIARAKADVAAGRTYPQAVVREWLSSGDRSGRRPIEEWLAEKRG